MDNIIEKNGLCPETVKKLGLNELITVKSFLNKYEINKHFKEHGIHIQELDYMNHHKGCCNISENDKNEFMRKFNIHSVVEAECKIQTLIEEHAKNCVHCLFNYKCQICKTNTPLKSIINGENKWSCCNGKHVCGNCCDMYTEKPPELDISMFANKAFVDEFYKNFVKVEELKQNKQFNNLDCTNMSFVERNWDD